MIVCVGIAVRFYRVALNMLPLWVFLSALRPRSGGVEGGSVARVSWECDLLVSAQGTFAVYLLISERCFTAAWSRGSTRSGSGARVAWGRTWLFIGRCSLLEPAPLR